MSRKGLIKYSDSEIVQMLIEKFPDAITHIHGSLELDFVRTVERFAKRIMEYTKSEMDRLSLFCKHIKTEDECIRYLAGYLPELSEACQEFLDDHLYMDHGDVYAWDEEDEDEEYDDIDDDEYEF